MNSKILKILIPVASLAACSMRAALYATGFDGRNLLIADHWARLGLLGLTALIALLLLLLGWFISGSDKYRDAHPNKGISSFGCYLASAALAFTCGAEFGDFSSGMHFVLWLLGILAALCFGFIGNCRRKGKRPYFLLHSVICIYFAMRTVLLYRVYSSDPMTQDYTFYLMAYVALMLNAYQHAAFDAKMGKHRPLWITGLAAVYLCCAATVHCPDVPLLAGGAIWAFTNLTNLTVRPQTARRATGAGKEAEAAQ